MPSINLVTNPTSLVQGTRYTPQYRRRSGQGQWIDVSSRSPAPYYPLVVSGGGQERALHSRFTAGEGYTARLSRAGSQADGEARLLY